MKEKECTKETPGMVEVSSVWEKLSNHASNVLGSACSAASRATKLRNRLVGFDASKENEAEEKAEGVVGELHQLLDGIDRNLVSISNDLEAIE